jgi:hypothetical protein
MPLPQTLAAIVVVVVDDVVVVVVVVDDVVVVGMAVVPVDELLVVDVVVVAVVDVVEESVVALVVVTVDVVVVSSVAVVDDVDVADVVVVEETVVDVVVVAVVVVDVVLVEPTVVVVGISGHGPSVARWMCVSWATKSPISVAPLFTWRSAFGAQSSRRTSAFRWIETVSPETNRSTSQGVTESSGTGPTSVALANITFPPTSIDVGTLARRDPFRATWRSPQKTYASPVRTSVPPFFTRTLPYIPGGSGVSPRFDTVTSDPSHGTGSGGSEQPSCAWALEIRVVRTKAAIPAHSITRDLCMSSPRRAAYTDSRRGDGHWRGARAKVHADATVPSSNQNE